MNYYACDNRMTHTRAKETMPPKKKQEMGKMDFIWTNDESELLRNIIHDPDLSFSGVGQFHEKNDENIKLVNSK